MEKMGKQTQIDNVELLQPIPEDVEAELDKILDAEDIDWYLIRDIKNLITIKTK